MWFTNRYRQHILGGLVQLGLGQPALSAYAALTQDSLIETVPNVAQDVPDRYPPEDSHDGTVLIFSTFSNPIVEFVLASSLKLRNYNPLLVTNYGSLPRETSLNYHWKEQAYLAVRRYNLKRFEHEFDVPVHPIRKVIEKEYEHPPVDNILLGDVYNCGDIEISPYATASARRYLQRYRLDPSSACYNRVYGDFVQAGAMIARAVENVTQQHDIIAGIATEHAYVHGGIPSEVLDKQDILNYVFGIGRICNNISIGLGRAGLSAPDFDPDEVVSAVRTYEMTDADRTLLRDHLPQTSGEVKRHIRYAKAGGTGLQHSDRFTVGVFSHLLWDGTLAPTAALFPDFYEWLRCTIDTLADRPEMDVYVKAHPAEELRGTDEHLSDWLDKIYPDLPSHIKFIPPDSEVSFYRMMSALDAGVVYASTAGAEMAYNRIPVVIGGYPPYMDYGIGFEPATRDAFVDLLKRLPELEVTPQMHARCERFLFHLFVNKQMPFPGGSFRDGEGLNITYDLLMSDEMDAIIDPIISGTTVQQRDLQF